MILALIFAAVSQQVPDILFILIPALVSLLVGITTGGWAGYNGWKQNQLRADEQKTEAETQRITSSNALFNDALALVNTLRDETIRLRTENQEFREKFDYLNKRIDTLEAENRQLRIELEDARRALAVKQ